MLEFRNVVFQYDSEDFNIIDGLSFHLEKGEFVSVIGPSGCGKSTIFRLTNQLLPRRSGEILVDGKTMFTFNKYYRLAVSHYGIVDFLAFLCYVP